MTEVLGLRLAYRGFVTGLAAAYVWLALAMIVAALVAGDALGPLRPLATALVDGAGTIPELAFVIGFALVQLGGALVGMCFAYFFGRFFTVRMTLAAAAPLFALLAWALLATGLATLTRTDAGLEMAPLVATIFYGLVLGIGLPLRGDVLRAEGATHGGSPVT
ncbi:MAG: hypothetical protein ABI534_00270 [Chloroflexota bacterium]